MECHRLSFSRHAITRMFERGLSVSDVRDVIAHGDAIASYPDDQPYPSTLLLGYSGKRPIHVVVAQAPADGACFVITAYEPDPAVWTDDFRRRR